METRINTYPLYVSGQYLTSEHLNETHNFLWQEIKLGRYATRGNGILNGLQADFTGSSAVKTITVSPGYGITLDGLVTGQEAPVVFDRCKAINLSIVQVAGEAPALMEKSVFDDATARPVGLEEKKVIAATELFGIELTALQLPIGVETIESKNITEAQALNNYSLIIWQSENEHEKTHCKINDCNIKGRVKEYVPRYFMLPNDSIPIVNPSNEKFKISRACRIKNLSQSGSKTGFYQANHAAWSCNFSEIMQYFSDSSLKNIKPIFAAANKDGLPKSVAQVGEMLTAINATVNNTNCPQYYTLFADILIKAINELIEAYNGFLEIFSNTNSTQRIAGILVLGGLRHPQFDSKRYYFIDAAPNIQMDARRKKLASLCNRIIAIVSNFVPMNRISGMLTKAENKVAIMPTCYQNSLQHTAIPFFFDVLNTNEVLRFWDPDGNGLEDIFCYFDAKVADRAVMASRLVSTSWMSDNFFRIEGHIGQSASNAITAIKKIVGDLGIPIQVLDCNIDYTGSTKMREFHTKLTSYLQTGIATLRSNPVVKNYPYDPLKNLMTASSTVSFRNAEEIKTVLNNFQAYTGVMYKATFPENSPVGKTSGTNVITKSVVDGYKAAFKQADIAQLIKDFGEATKDVTVNPDGKRLLILKDLIGLEYLGGAPRGGTFVVLHSNNIVVGDGCLPYYFRVEQGRVF